MIKKQGDKFIVTNAKGNKIGGPFNSKPSAQRYNKVAMKLTKGAKGK